MLCLVAQELRVRLTLLQGSALFSRMLRCSGRIHHGLFTAEVPGWAA